MMAASSSRLGRPQRLALLALLIKMSCWTPPLPQVAAWSLADRLSGRAFPPQEPNNGFRRLRSRRKVRDPYDEHNDKSPSGGRHQRASAARTTTTSTKQNQRDMVSFMERSMNTLVGDLELPPRTTPETDDLAEMVRVMAAAADGRKASDVVALRVSHCTTLTSFVLICTGTSRPQNQAIANAITKTMAHDFGLRPGGQGVPEGSAASGWILLDYGSVMVHIMSPKSRLFYNVEGQWRDKGGQPMNLDNVLVPNSPPQNGMLVDDAASLSEDQDPFWS